MEQGREHVPEVLTGEIQGNVRKQEGTPSPMATRKPRAVIAEPGPGPDRTAITQDRDWRSGAERTMVTILDRAQDLAASCGDIKQLIELGRMVGETLVAGDLAMKDERNGKKETSGDEGGEGDD